MIYGGDRGLAVEPPQSRQVESRAESNLRPAGLAVREL